MNLLLVTLVGVGVGAGVDKVNANAVISEVLSHSDPPLEDAIELQNMGVVAVDIGSWWLSDSSNEPFKYRIPPGTILEPGGFAVFYQVQLSEGAGGFQLNSSEGDQVHLTAVDGSGAPTGYRASASFGALKNGVSVGRVVTLQGEAFLPLSRPTFGVENPGSLVAFRQGRGQSNAPARIGPIVISELMFDPEPSGAGVSEEYVELANVTDAPVPLYDPRYPTNTYRIADGITFRVPLLQTMPARGYAVVVGFDPGLEAARAAAFRSAWNMPAEAILLGPFSGRLNNTGERVVLRWPDEPQGLDRPDAGFVPYETLDEVSYEVSPPWPAGARENGRSLQRSGVALPGADAGAWVVEPGTPGRGLEVNSQADGDGDGMPNVWEVSFGLNPADASDGAGDLDGDGASNLDEYVADTDPRSAVSVMRIRSIRAMEGGVDLEWDGTLQRRYWIEVGSRLEGGSWDMLEVTPESVGSGTLRFRASLPSGEGVQRYFRIRVSVP